MNRRARRGEAAVEVELKLNTNIAGQTHDRKEIVNNNAIEIGRDIYSNNNNVKGSGPDTGYVTGAGRKLKSLAM